MTTYCFYHRVDLDGQSSGSIVKYFKPEVELRPFNYHDEFPWDEIKPEDTLYFVDVTIQPYDKLVDLYHIVGEKLYIFDHHKSFLESEAYKFLQTHIPLNLNCNPTAAGCELTWTALSSSKPLPKAVQLLGQYDAWREKKEKQFGNDFDWDNEVMPFQFGMRLSKLDPTSEDDRESFYRLLEDPDLIDDIIDKGKTVLKYQDNQNEFAMRSSFKAKIKGYTCLCLNGGLRNSRVYASKWDNEIYDFMVSFSMTKHRTWSWSFYTDKEGMDASVLARQFGGGGHRGAAGSLTEELIFD